MHVNSILLAAVIVAIPLTLATLWFIANSRRWRTYRVAIDVSRAEGERPPPVPEPEADEEAEDEEDEVVTAFPVEGEPSGPFLRGPGGLRGWVLRHLYPYYRRR
jgi:hypothetical protein